MNHRPVPLKQIIPLYVNNKNEKIKIFEIKTNLWNNINQCHILFYFVSFCSPCLGVVNGTIKCIIIVMKIEGWYIPFLITVECTCISSVLLQQKNWELVFWYCFPQTLQDPYFLVWTNQVSRGKMNMYFWNCLILHELDTAHYKMVDM